MLKNILPINLILPETGIESYDNHIRCFNQSEYPKTLEGLRDYLNSQYGKIKPTTVNHKIQAFKKSAWIAMKKDHLSAIDMYTIQELWKSSIPRLKIDKKIYDEKLLSEVEIQMLISEATPKLALIIEFLYKTGLRISEFTQIQISKLSNRNGHIYIPILGKGKKERRVFITEEFYNRINTVFTGKVYLFENRNMTFYCKKQLWREINNLGLKVLGFSIHPHTFRHCFATHMIIYKNKSLKAVSNYLGHSTTSITADMYLHDELKPEDLL
jgi:integrase/recombinase XerD